MSTRCNIIVKSGKSTVYLYRHSDGYPAETGADLLAKVQTAYGPPDAHRSIEGAADHFVRAIFAEHYEQQSYETSPKAVYELTTDLHGDIEHCYQVEFAEMFAAGPVSIRHAARPANWHESGHEVEDWARGRRYSLQQFAELVNAERRDMNARLAKLRTTSKHYADATDYPMVTA